MFASGLKKAPRQGAFFYVAVSVLLLGPGGVYGRDQPQCLSTKTDETVEIADVIDGDTVRLVDGRRLRLIGINAPELAHDNRSAEPMADEATQYLRRLLENAGSISVRFGIERQDHYRRWLAHLFIDGRQNVQARLLEQGLAVRIAVPPNIWGQDCYRLAEAEARRHRRGLWTLAYFQPLPVESMSDNSRGFRRIQGRVTRITRTEHSVWLDFDNNIAVRIARPDWSYFSKIDFDQLLAKEVVVRGWVYRYQGQLRLRLRHPNDMAQLH